FVPPEGGWPRSDKDLVRQDLVNRSRDLQARLTVDGKLLQVGGDRMVLLDAATGRLLWAATAAAGAVWGHPIVRGDAVFAVEGPWANSWSYTHWPMVGVQRVHRLDLGTGATRWVYAAPPDREPIAAYNLTHGAGRLAMVSRSRLNAKGELCVLILADDDGRETAFLPRPLPGGRGGIEIGGGHSGARGTIIGDRLHITSIGQVLGSLPVADPATAAAERPYARMERPVGCTVFRSAGDWIFGSLTVYGLDGGGVHHTNATRTACDVGAFPANGLSYITPNHCFCLPYLPGSMAFHPRPFAGEEELPRLEPGPARPAPSPVLTGGNGAWPMLLANHQRGAWVDDPLPPVVKPVWQARPAGDGAPPAPIAEAWTDHWYAQGPVTQASVADGLVVVGASHRQQIVAYDAATGRERWRTSVDGRIDSAPTIAGSLVVAGTRNGWIYALDRADGRVAWRFFAAPRRDRIIVDGQPESVWPCFGSVPVTDEGVWALAGRHGDSDGGLWWWRLDLATGSPRAQGRIGLTDLHKDTTMKGILAHPAVVDRGLYQIPGLTLRITDGRLQEWTPDYTAKGQRWSEWDGWYERFARGVLTPGNQGILARVEFLGGYKLSQYGLASGRLFAFKGDEFAAVGGSPTPQHRGGNNDSALRRMRRLPAIATIEVPDAKDPTRIHQRQVGNRLLWEQGNMGLWRGDGLGAIAVAGDALLVGGEVTNRDRWKERQAMPFRLRLLHLDSGEPRQDDLALPAKPLVGGISSDDGRIFVVTADGTLSAFGP
ncbi:MAG: Serine/threonine-protein kinase AfsK, partial [Planctomycetota bacterium]